jgi:hypothetical protein
MCVLDWNRECELKRKQVKDGRSGQPREELNFCAATRTAASRGELTRRTGVCGLLLHPDRFG